MLYSTHKKEALKDMKDANNIYNEKFSLAVNHMEMLQSTRMEAIKVIKQVEEFIDILRNRPYEYQKLIAEIKARREKFEVDVHNLEIESKKADKVSGTLAGAGALAGAGIAAFGPTAAMSVAMTFGTASTGTAIATLSGAAATNAALAWLGGGALTAGGLGMAGGQALLGLAGPIGWVIGGTALVGSGALAKRKNKEVAKKAEESARAIRKETYRINKIDVKVVALDKETIEIRVKTYILLSDLYKTGIIDYNEFNDDQINDLGKMMNLTETLSKKIGEVVI